MSLCWFACVGGGGTREPVMTQGAPETGREVGLMYSFSSQSEDDLSLLNTAEDGRDLVTHRKHKAINKNHFLKYKTDLDNITLKLRPHHKLNLCYVNVTFQIKARQQVQQFVSK